MYAKLPLSSKGLCPKTSLMILQLESLHIKNKLCSLVPPSQLDQKMHMISLPTLTLQDYST